VARDDHRDAPEEVSREFTTGLVLAAGGSKRLGQPKQLLPYGSATLLDHVLNTARACSFDQLVCVVGGGADEIKTRVNLPASTSSRTTTSARAARRRSPPP
jgi:CTP:molybdopterin cytidylyltransferase MocA